MLFLVRERFSQIYVPALWISHHILPFPTFQASNDQASCHERRINGSNRQRLHLKISKPACYYGYFADVKNSPRTWIFIKAALYHFMLFQGCKTERILVVPKGRASLIRRFHCSSHLIRLDVITSSSFSVFFSRIRRRPAYHCIKTKEKFYNRISTRHPRSGTRSVPSERKVIQASKGRNRIRWL